MFSRARSVTAKTRDFTLQLIAGLEKSENRDLEGRA